MFQKLSIICALLFLSALPTNAFASRRLQDPPPPPPLKHVTQAGDWFTRIRALYLLPHNSSHSFKPSLPPYGGGGVDFRPCWMGEFDVGCMFTNQFGFELGVSTSKTNVRGTRTLYNQKLGSTWLFPPTFTLQWRFAPAHVLQPYIGGGANYTLFYNTSSSLPSTKLKLSHSWGPVAQAGIDLFFSEDHPWIFNFDIKYIWIKTKVSLRSHSTSIATNTTHDHINPWVFGVGLGRKW